MATAAIAQADLSPGITDKNPDRHGFSCPEGSVFSQVPDDATGFYRCQLDTPSLIAATNYTAEGGRFTSFRFWGFDAVGCNLEPIEPFYVYVWNENPADRGDLIFSGEFDGLTLVTEEIIHETEIYQIDIDFGEVINQEAGYIGITRINPSCDVSFAWLAYTEGDGDVQMFGGDSWSHHYHFGDLFFCLSYEAPVPIKNWTIYLTTLLIGIFFIFRIRKIF